MTENRALGWLPDLPSIKDYTSDHPVVAPMLAATSIISRTSSSKPNARRGSGASTLTAAAATTAPAALAPNVDLRPWCSPIEDQGLLGSCTANAAVGLVEYMERRASGRSIDASRLFVYKTTRNLLKWTGDTGAYLRTTMEALVLFGAPPEAYWSYDGRAAASNTHFELEPNSFCYAFADNFKTIKYLRLDPAGASLNDVLTNIRTYLNSGFGCMFGLPVYTEFDNPTPSGDIAFPSPNSHCRGGHAICAIGYDDNRVINGEKGALLIRNSWGTGYGLNGYAWLSYKYVTAGLAKDWWTLIAQNWVDTGKFS